MLIFTIDDEMRILDNDKQIIKQAVPDAEIMTFTRAEPALKAISDNGMKPDIVFSDMEMPGITGLEFAARIKMLSPETKIVFVTGHSQYALDAFKVRASGYLLKPLTVQAVADEIRELTEFNTDKPIDTKLTVKCFGSFEVFFKGKPIDFSREKTKELLAYLIDRKGEYCTFGNIIGALWEDDSKIKNKNNYLRVLINDLTSTLKAVKMEKLLIKKRAQLAVDRNMLDCDYYKMLDANMKAVNFFTGSYMEQYSWAEITAGELYFRSLK